jgi:hypothetical protein
VSLAVDTAGAVHLCYNGRDALKYASRSADGSTWQIETVETDWYLYGSLAVDSQDRPHISYGRDSLKHAVREDGVWQTETVENPPDSDVRGSSLVVDSAGRVHIGYAVEVYVGDSHVRLASLEASGWVTETVASGPEQATSSISLALDQSGSPYLSYGLIRWSGVYHYLLRVAWRGNAGWQQETVASHDNDRWGEDYRSSLAVDSAGRIHLAYQSVSGNYSSAPTLVGPLQYALADSAGWQRETVDRSAKAGLGSSLALDAAGRPVISYSADGLWLADFDAGQWGLAMLDPLGATATSLSLDAGGQRRIAYLAYYTRYHGPEPVELRLGQADAGQWQSQVIDRPSEPDIALAVDGQGRPGIAYTYHNRLLYASPSGSVWRSDLVDPSVAGGASLAILANGAPHISYVRDGLRYATRDAAGWHTEIVHAYSAWEGQSALAIDGTGQPHIGCYLRPYNQPGQLFYAVRSASGWQVEAVDGGAGQDVGRFVSLALDAAGRPHLSYYDAASGALKYAWRDAAGWHVQTVDGDQGTDVGQYTALVLAEAGRPIISYYDVTHGDLKVARLAAFQGSAMLPLVAVDRGGAP